MTENANPKPFNISRQYQRRKFVRTALLGLSICQSKDTFTVRQTGWTEFR